MGIMPYKSNCCNAQVARYHKRGGSMRLDFNHYDAVKGNPRCTKCGRFAKPRYTNLEFLRDMSLAFLVTFTFFMFIIMVFALVYSWLW